MEESTHRISKLDPQKSIRRARTQQDTTGDGWSITVAGTEIAWSSKMERVSLIREGIPYEAISVVGKRADLSVREMLTLMGMPQTTYNKKKRDKDLLNGRDSEVILLLTELLDYGVEVFNNEREKFYRWLKKPNASLGGVKPETLFDSVTGIQVVQNGLHRLEYGNMA